MVPAAAHGLTLMAIAVAALVAGWTAATAPAVAQSSAALRGASSETPVRPGAGPAVRDRARPRALRRGPPQAGLPPRVRSQNFRSLERPPNVAINAPAEPVLVPQGLPPPVDPRRRRIVEQNPYEPLGLNLGGLRLRTGVEALIGYDDNANRTGGASRRRGSVVYRTGADLALRSDWSRHELTGDLRGSFTAYPDVSDADRPEATGRLALRIDATRDTAITTELRGRLDTERPGSVNLSSSVQGRPLVLTYGASTGVTQRFNRLAVTVQGNVDRAEYDNAQLRDGGTLDQSNRNTTAYGLRTRLAYEVTPGLIPFVEAIVDTREYDTTFDPNGFRRSSDGAQARLGSTYELTRTLTGEASAGYGIRRYDDPRLRDLKGPILEAILTWSMSPLTTLRLRANTSFDETTTAGSSGALTRLASLELTHDLLRNLRITGTASFSRSDYQGVRLTEDQIRAGVGLDYSITRNVVARASYAYERTISSSPGGGISANVVLFGLRLQY
jgi:hypothetical protein